MILKDLSLWSHKLKEGFQLSEDFLETYEGQLLKNPKKIAFVGMGGSGIAGRIIKTFLDRKEEISTFIIDSSELPTYIDTATQVFVVSYSGNTWETVCVLNQLVEKFIPTVVITHGGKAAEIAEQKSLPLILLPESVAPRTALGHILGFLLGIFERANLLEGSRKLDIFVKNADIYIPKFSEEYYFKDFLDVVEGYEFFHVWGISGDSAAFAYRAQTQFNENSKVHCVFSAFPELNHNLINGFVDCKEHPCVVFFYTEFLPLNLNLAVEATCEILKEYNVALYKPPILGDNFEGQLFNIVLWSDFASYYLGKGRNVNVENTQVIDDLKNRQRLKGIK